MKNEITEKEVGEFDNVLLCIITFSAVTPENVTRYLFSFYNSFSKNGFFVIYFIKIF